MAATFKMFGVLRTLSDENDSGNSGQVSATFSAPGGTKRNLKDSVVLESEPLGDRGEDVSATDVDRRKESSTSEVDRPKESSASDVDRPKESSASDVDQPKESSASDVDSGLRPESERLDDSGEDVSAINVDRPEQSSASDAETAITETERLGDSSVGNQDSNAGFSLVKNNPKVCSILFQI
jgi:hypothetical protein